MNMTTAILILISSVAALAWGQGTTTPTVQPLTSKMVILPTTEFEQSKIESRFEGYLAASSPDTRFLLIRAIDREQSFQLAEIGFTDVTYGLWRLLFSDYERQIPPFAELLQINGNVGIRLRDREGRITTKVLRGRNPYAITGCGTAFPVLHVSLTTTRDLEDPQRSSSNLHFFVLSDSAVNQEIARCVLTKVRELGLGGNLAVSIRKDPWFIQDSDYPVVLPFLESIQPPSKEQYEKALQSYCGLYEGKVICW